MIAASRAPLLDGGEKHLVETDGGSPGRRLRLPHLVDCLQGRRSTILDE